MQGTNMAAVVAMPVAAAVVMLPWAWPMIIQDGNGGLSVNESSIFGPGNRKAP